MTRREKEGEIEGKNLLSFGLEREDAIKSFLISLLLFRRRGGRQNAVRETY